MKGVKLPTSSRATKLAPHEVAAIKACKGVGPYTLRNTSFEVDVSELLGGSNKTSVFLSVADSKQYEPCSLSVSDGKAQIKQGSTCDIPWRPGLWKITASDPDQAQDAIYVSVGDERDVSEWRCRDAVASRSPESGEWVGELFSALCVDLIAPQPRQPADACPSAVPAASPPPPAAPVADTKPARTKLPRFMNLRASKQKPTDEDNAFFVPGFELATRRSIFVVVMTPEDPLGNSPENKGKVAITLKGADGLSLPVFDSSKGPGGAALASGGTGSNAGTSQESAPQAMFGPQLGPNVSLTITLDPPGGAGNGAAQPAAPAVLPGAKPAVDKQTDPAPGGGDKETHTRNYLVETLYRGAFRLGVGGSFSPWARDYLIQSNPGGQKYVTQDPNMNWSPGVEVLAGYSIFLCTRGHGCFWRGGGQMSDMHPSWGLALNGALGTFKYGANGLTGLSSLRFGPEVVYGLDFSLVFAFGANRHDIPADGYQPGQLLPAGATQMNTRFGVAPGFGVILNLPSSILKPLNITAGG